ncbi:hypothetical protein AD998_16105 [bacterium 336/3]|nr:hypothetical protein AD998_16105 [bacterium 336/3]
MNFEQEWRDKMLYANVAPNETVWEGVALHLAQKRKKSHTKKWIFWWAAAMFPLFLGDGQFLWFSNENTTPLTQQQNETVTIHQPQTLTTNTPTKAKNIIIKKEPLPTHENKLVFVASADYGLESQKILSKRQSEEKPLEVLGKPKQRRFWMQTYSSLEQSFTKFDFHSLVPTASRSPFVSPAIAQVEKRVKDELASYTPLVSWRLGIDGGYQINHHWYVTTGLHFTRNIASLDVNAQNKYPEIAKFYGEIPVTPIPIAIATIPTTPNVESIVTEDQDMLITTFMAVAEPKSKKFIQKTDYISIPVKVGYQIQKNRFRYALALGAEGSYLLNNSFSSQEEQLNQVVKHLNRYQVSALAEISVGVSVSDKALLHISPTFRKSLNSPFAINSPLQQTQNFTIGLSGGVQYRF